jgi:septum formation protein
VTPRLWLGGSPLVLASGSATRRDLLLAAGLAVEVVRPEINERAVSEPLERAGAGGGRVATRLARIKAAAGSRLAPGRLTLGADQTLTCEGRFLHKPADRTAAGEQLAFLAARTHVLSSASALAVDGRIVWASLRSARLTMRRLTPEMIARYLDAAGDRAFASVGGYQLEAVGIQLFERVSGDHSTILGLPLLPLFAELRRRGLLPE